MKKILTTVLLVLSLSVNAAGVIAEAENKGGGGIALTDITCKTVKNTFVAYSYIQDGRSILGCWASDDTRVFIQWSDGDTRSYPIESFNMKKKTSGRML